MEIDFDELIGLVTKMPYRGAPAAGYDGGKFLIVASIKMVRYPGCYEDH